MTAYEAIVLKYATKTVSSRPDREDGKKKIRALPMSKYPTALTK